MAPIVLNQLLTFAVGVVGVRLISALVPPAINGPYALFLTLVQLGVLLTHSGIINHASRYWQREDRQAGTYLRFIWSSIWRLSLYLMPPLLLASAALLWQGGAAEWPWAFPSLVIGNLALVFHTVAMNAFTANSQLWTVCALGFAANLSRIILPIGLVLLAGVSFAVLLAGYALHSLFLSAWLIFLFRRKWAGAPPPSRERRSRWLEELRRYGRPFILLGIGAWLLQSADRWLVTVFYGQEQAGLFALASNIGSIVPTMALGGLMQLAFPAIFRAADRAGSHEDWRQLARRCDSITLGFLLLTATGLILARWLCPHLVGTLISAPYASAVGMLIPAGWASVASQINQFYYLLLQGQHDSGSMVKVMLTIAGIKMVGGVLAALSSWQIFLWWLTASAVLSGVIGRTMILRFVLERGPVCRKPD